MRFAFRPDCGNDVHQVAITALEVEGSIHKPVITTEAEDPDLVHPSFPITEVYFRTVIED